MVKISYFFLYRPLQGVCYVYYFRYSSVRRQGEPRPNCREPKGQRYKKLLYGVSRIRIPGGPIFQIGLIVELQEDTAFPKCRGVPLEPPLLQHGCCRDCRHSLYSPLVRVATKKIHFRVALPHPLPSSLVTTFFSESFFSSFKKIFFQVPPPPLPS